MEISRKIKSRNCSRAPSVAASRAGSKSHLSCAQASDSEKEIKPDDTDAEFIKTNSHKE